MNMRCCSTEGRRRQLSEPASTGDTDPVKAYKHIQRGGEIPYKGLQKPAPEKSSEYSYGRIMCLTGVPFTLFPPNLLPLISQSFVSLVHANCIFFL